METLNFQDEEQFSEFPFQLDDEHLLDTDVMDILNCDEISQIIENHEFNFTTFDSNNPTLETKQALDENLVTMPAIEDIAQKKTLKEDYAKVLNKWQEHVDCLEKSDMDLQLSDLDLQMNENFIDDFYNSTSSSIPLSPVNRILQKSTENNFYTSFAQDFGKISKVNILNNNLEVDSNTRELNPLHQTDNSLQETTNIDNLNNLNVGDNKKIESNHHDKKIKSDYHDKIESDHSETEIDVVGIDSVDELNSSSIFLDERSQNNRTKSETKNRKYNSTLLGNNIILIKQEHNSHKGKKKSPNIRVDKKPAETFSSRNDSKISKDDKNLLKKQKNSIPIKKKKCEKVLIEHPNRGKKKPKKDSKLENSEQKPVALHATNVASLLEQFEATENAATANVNNGYNTKNRFMSRDNCNSKTVHKKNIKKSKNIYEVSPEEIVSKIKASENQKSKKKIAIIPAIPLKKEDSKRVEMKKKESRSFKIQNKSKNKVSEDPQLSSPCHSNVDVPIFFDHDYCVTQNIKFKKCCKSNSNVIDCSGNDNKVPKNVPMKSSKSLNDKIKQMNCSQKSSTLVKKQICKPTDSKSHFDDGMHKKEDTSSNVKLNERMIALNETSLKQPNHTLPSKSKSECQSNLYLNKTAVITPMNKTKTDSVLSEKVLTQSSPHDKSCDSMFNSNQQLVSVLKKPPTASTQNFSGQNESIITTTNSSNDRVKNIIVQHLKPELSENVPQRKKLNLAEYRSRKGTHKIVYKMEKSPVSLAYDPSYADCETSINSKPCVEINNEKSRENNFDEGIQMLDAPISNTINHKIDLLVSEAKLNEKVQVKVELEYAKENNQSISSELVEQENEKKLTKQIATKVEPVEEGEIEDSEQSDQNDVKPVLSIKCEKEELKYEKVVIENDDLRIADVKKPLASSTSSRDRKMRRYSKKYRDSSESSLSRSRSRSHSSHRSDSPRSSRNPRRQSHNRRSHRDRSCSYRSRSTRSRSRSYEYRYRSHNGRSRSRKCSVKRNKRISRRRSSVSSRSSWSSRSWSRSRSRYRSSSSYSRSSRSTSRSKSRLRSGSRSRSWKSRSRSPRRCFSRRSSYSRSPISQYRRPNEKWYNNEKQRQIEERRVVYVGQLEDNITKSDLRRRFEVFGSVIDLSLHFRDRGHNYGFVTYAYKDDAYKAVEHGNDDPKLPRYDLCFGGRRQFCQQKYADLDGAATNSYYNNDRGENVYKPPQQKESFDFLLKETKEIMRKRVV